MLCIDDLDSKPATATKPGMPVPSNGKSARNQITCIVETRRAVHIAAAVVVSFNSFKHTNARHFACNSTPNSGLLSFGFFIRRYRRLSVNSATIKELSNRFADFATVFFGVLFFCGRVCCAQRKVK